MFFIALKIILQYSDFKEWNLIEAPNHTIENVTTEWSNISSPGWGTTPGVEINRLIVLPRRIYLWKRQVCAGGWKRIFLLLDFTKYHLILVLKYSVLKWRQYGHTITSLFFVLLAWPKRPKNPRHGNASPHMPPPARFHVHPPRPKYGKFQKPSVETFFDWIFFPKVKCKWSSKVDSWECDHVVVKY